MANAFWLTNSLTVGVPESISNAISVHSPDEAVEAIEAGKVAAFPQDSWDEAREVLSRFGLSEEQVKRRERFARTGLLS